ncbi:PREDICTED: uncharacterized protein LOC103330763 [Prunus mume]|uniref:Uncharacterized protein LOC103330763 n=1 Tax=Prunus mume TaxID=102107 RepID=A0ABM1LS42_PRUMU|nr:PREDICTED: uncharacterized protein LOC103330763 [Prunus mume]XP_016650219.1 PREDICTED: uncharacterized protein LOC103330763 [Prunus mume]
MANIVLRNLHSLVQKRLLATLPTPTSALCSSFTVEYLVQSCGLPLESAISTSKKLQIDKKQTHRIDFMLKFLKSNGFDDAQIAKLITKRPTILHYKVLNNLEPKFNFLIENGFVGQNLPELVLLNPVILTRSLDSHIKPAVQFLKKLLSTNDMLAAAKRSSWLLNMDSVSTIQPNVALLQNEGVPLDVITKMILFQPRTVMQNVDRMAYAVRTIKDLGIDPTGPMFVRAVRVMISMKESTWKRKIDFFKSYGWSEDVVLSVFKRQPFCLACSEEKLGRVMDFFLNTVKLEPETMIANPMLLMHGFEKTVLPRYNVFKILVSKKLIKRDNKRLCWLITQSERRFLDYYVLKYLNEVPDLLEIYHSSKEETIEIP